MKNIGKEHINYERLYRTTDQWLSDLAFYKDVLCFLKKLLNRYHSEIIQLENLDEIRESTMCLQDLWYDRNTIVNKIRVHQNKLTKIIDGDQESFFTGISQEHIGLYHKINLFLKNFKAIKKEIFCITEHVLEEQKKAVF